MNDTQAQAFFAAAGFHDSTLMLLIQLAVGGIAVLCSVLVLIGLMRLLDTNSAWDKTIFLICMVGLSFALMMVFIYLA